MRARLATLALAALLVAPASAAASDQSVWDAYAHARRAELRQAVNAYDRAAGHPRRISRAIAAGRRVSRTLGRIAADVRLEAPSSTGGEQAKGLLLDSLAAWRRAMALDGRSLRMFHHGRLARGNAAGIRSNAALARSDRLEARAVRALRAAGVKL
jgi:hypothetical protein